MRWHKGHGYQGQMVYNAIKKYGWENIEHKILKTGLTLEEANYWERYYIQFFKTLDFNYGYNQNSGGDSGKGDISKQQVSQYDIVGDFIKTYSSMTEACLENKLNRELGISGITHCCKGQSNTCYGYRWAYGDSTQPLSPLKGTRGNGTGIAVDQYDLNGNFICSYSKMKDADKAFNNPNAHKLISRVCSGERKTALGYIWRYHNTTD